MFCTSETRLTIGQAESGVSSRNVDEGHMSHLSHFFPPSLRVTDRRASFNDNGQFFQPRFPQKSHRGHGDRIGFPLQPLSPSYTFISLPESKTHSTHFTKYVIQSIYVEEFPTIISQS